MPARVALRRRPGSNLERKRAHSIRASGFVSLARAYELRDEVAPGLPRGGVAIAEPPGRRAPAADRQAGKGLLLLEFLRWIGVTVPRWIENELRHAEETLEASYGQAVATAVDLIAG